MTEQIQVLHLVEAGARSFTFVGRGTFNNVTNRIVLNGEVGSGWMAGAQVHDEALRTEPSLSRFVGTFRLTG